MLTTKKFGQNLAELMYSDPSISPILSKFEGGWQKETIKACANKAIPQCPLQQWLVRQ